MKQPLPILNTDKEAEAFVENADLTDYDLTALKQIRSLANRQKTN